MENKQPDSATDRRRKTCQDVANAQNAYLSGLCAKKFNTLSCRCSGCSSDDTLPVINSAADAAMLNTAYDGSGGFKTSGLDLHWEVGIGTRTLLPTAWAQAQVVATIPSPSWAGPFSNANWISNDPGGDPSKNPPNVSNVEAYFRYKFNLGSSVNPATFAIAMSFYADNRVWEIYVNGVPQSTQPNGAGILPQFPVLTNAGQGPDDETSGFGKGRQVLISLNNNWVRCDNEIIVQVRSPGGFMGFLAENTVKAEIDTSGCDCHCDCSAVPFPDIHPCISVKWGDSACDCMETDDVEVLCVTVCNCYSNVTFGDLSIGQIQVTDMAGNPVATLPDGTPSVQVIPSGPICFGDIGPCQEGGKPSCVSRELVLYTRGAVGKSYRLSFSAICFTVCHEYQSDQCFTLKLCQD